MPRVYVSVGSNIDRERNVRGAVQRLRERYGHVLLSQIYESKAIGFDGDAFYNLVVGFNTDEPLPRICQHLLSIEHDYGRRRGEARFCPRTLDLDLLLYGDAIECEGRCCVPRAEILEYAFVLRPLAEIAPGERHPETGLSFHELWQRFKGPADFMRPVAFDPAIP